MKKTVSLVLTLIFIVACFASVSAASNRIAIFKTDVGIAVNGEMVGYDRPPVAVNERILASVRDTFEKLQVRVDWYPESNFVVMSRDSVTIAMTIGSEYARVNGSYWLMEAPPVLDRGTVMVPVRFVAEMLKENVLWDGRNKIVYIGKPSQNTTISRGTERGSKSKFKVVIDPGHGGKDPGAQYGGVAEKNLNLDISKRLNTLLQGEGVKTYMTRTTDTYISLYSRSGLANSVNADLFISVHSNAGRRGEKGSMSLYYPSYGKFTGVNFAAIVQRELVNTLGTRDLGLYSRPKLAVLRTTRMPAVIAEIGYMSDPGELSKLKTPEFRQKAAEALKNAVLKALEAK